MSKQSGNIGAFLDTIAWSEGTTHIEGSDDGYNVLVGGTLFEGYQDHPRTRVHLRPGLDSTAAGRYQLLARYYDAYTKLLGLEDFGPEAQDQIAIQQIKERGAMPDVESGHFYIALAKVRNIWASLPGAGYGQHENAMSDLAVAYFKAGGSIA